MALHLNLGKTKGKTGKIVGSLRRFQLITSFGPGSIVNMPGMSVMIAGTDHWDDSCPVIHEHNLERLLRVSHFREPSVSEDGHDSPNIPAIRFPYYHFCADPKCGRLMPFWRFKDREAKTCAEGHRKAPIVPSRFVVACTNGHIEDFPYNWWVHHGDHSKCPSSKTAESLRIHFSDESGGLDSITIECTACGSKRKMTGCMNPDALKGYYCKGKRPWLGRNVPPEECNAMLRVLQRGASNVYFPVNASALTIPPWSSEMQKEISKQWLGVKDYLDNCGQDFGSLRSFVSIYFARALKTHKYSVEEIISEIKARYEDGGDEGYSKQKLMEDEYRQLCGDDYESADDLQFRTERAPVPETFEGHITDVVLVKRLREVMALQGFRRVSPEEAGGDGGYVSLGEASQFWLPAIELLGEGIFIRLNEDAVKRWESRWRHEYVQMRNRLNGSNVGCDNFSARYVLLHTLSHLLIRQLALECGYSSASMREKIYSTYPGAHKQMCGILLYTSSSDSDGSLGGLVRKGKPEFLGMIMKTMLQEALWCSSDPICIESKAQGLDSLNYAACHACTLLPETSCEMRNCLLDRTSIVGRFENRDRGYFGEFLDKI